MQNNLDKYLVLIEHLNILEKEMQVPYRNYLSYDQI